MAGRHAELERLVLDSWPIDRLLTPDEVRGEHDSLPVAIASDGLWRPASRPSSGSSWTIRTHSALTGNGTWRRRAWAAFG